jgi:heme/copper-type cytochrome/quinol oxidase subunit 2
MQSEANIIDDYGFFASENLRLLDTTAYLYFATGTSYRLLITSTDVLHS